MTQMQWQPIETAPRDGTIIIIWDGISVIPAVYVAPLPFDEWKETIADDDWDEEDYDLYVDADCLPEGWYACEPPEVGAEEFTQVSPSLWQPLPPPPETARSEP